MPVTGGWARATSLVLGAARIAAGFIARVPAPWHWFRHMEVLPESIAYWELPGIFTLVYAAFGWYAGIPLGASEDMRRAAAGTGLACLLLMAAVFCFPTTGSYSRGLLTLSGCFTALAVPPARSLARHLFSYRLDDGGTQSERAGVPAAGPLTLARTLAQSLRFRHAAAGIPDAARQDPFRMLDDWGAIFRRVILIPNLFGDRPDWARDPSGVPGLELRQDLSIPLNRWTKRLLDIAGAVVLGILALPVLAAAAIWIKLAGGGPVIYSQERGGKCGHSLWIPKLRTMHPDAEALLPRVLSASPQVRAEWTRRFKLKDDPRILPGIGRFLRRTSLDELPQLWTVLKGEMSLVGPRPFPRYHLDGFGPRFRALRDSVRPGLTGLWQVSDRADGDLAVQEALDTYYIRNWSLWLDLYILARTVKAVLFPKGAY